MSDLGDVVVKDIFEQLNIDTEWSSPIPRGFAWWGHRLRQRIWTTPGYNDDGIIIHRLFAVTDVVTAIGIPTANVDIKIGPLGGLALGAAAIYSPSERSIRLWSAVTIHEDIAPWMTRLFTSYAILQLIEAEQKADGIAQLVSGEVDLCPHTENGLRHHPDEMLSVLDSVFRPLGKKASPWRGNQELNQIREYLNAGNCFSMGDDEGLTAEFPFGEGTSMMRVVTGEQHPLIGSGVGIFLHVPMWGNENEAAQIAGALNRAEADRQSMSHILGSWCSKTVGDRSLPAFAFFLPTALYQPGLLTNLTFSFASRANWVSSLLNPEATTADVIDIVSNRFQQLADAIDK